MKHLPILFAVLAAFFGTPARADITAVYRGTKTGGEMTVEVAANGSVRATTGGRGDYYLLVDGRSYFVFSTDKGLVADDVNDVTAALHDYVNEKMPEFGKLWEKASKDEFAGPKAVEGGQLTIHGRPGTIWYLQMVAGAPLGDPNFVISTDPALAELGKAMAHQFELSAAAADQAFGHRIGMATTLLEVLRKGAPLRFSGMDLVSVSTTPIAADRFALPVRPETREQVRARLYQSGGHIP